MRSMLIVSVLLIFGLFLAYQPGRPLKAQAGEQASPITITEGAPVDLNKTAPGAAGLPPPALMVRPDSNRPSEPLKLSKLDVKVSLNGPLSETTMTMTFQNPNSRVLEGDLYFPLPEGATICGYALDMHGQLVDGVIVEKEEARITFEKEVRKGIDPGLVEWVKGNNFRTRVYPIPAGGTRTVRVSYVSGLSMESSGLATYRLPLRFPQAIPEFHLRVEGPAGAQPQVTLGTAMPVEQTDNRFVADLSRTDVTMDGDLQIVLTGLARTTLAVEKAASGNHYFYIAGSPDASFATSAVPSPAAHIPHIGIYWDASASHGQADRTRETAVLEGLMHRLGSADVDLVLFRNDLERRGTFAVRNGDAGPLLAALKDVVYDGGTNLGALEFTRNSARTAGSNSPDYSYWLLFSDGLGNLGDSMPRLVEAPVYAISQDARADHLLLRYLGQSSGGDYLNLERVSAEEAARSIGSSGLSVLSVSYDPKQITDVYPRGVQPVHGQFTVAGRLLAPEAALTVNFGRGGQVLGTARFTIQRSGGLETGLIPRAWAQLKVDDLSVLPEQNKAELLALGREFGIVTPGSSLLVLESIDQYVHYHIPPPRTLPEMYAEYTKRVTQEEQETKSSRSSKLETVVQMWQHQVDWWNTKFSYPPHFRYVEPAEKKPGLATGSAPIEAVVDASGANVSYSAATGAVRGAGAPAHQAPAEVEAELRQSEDAPAPPAAMPSAPAQVTDRYRSTGGLGVQAAREPGQGLAYGTGLARLQAADRTSLAGGRPAQGAVDTREDSAATIAIKPWDPNTPYLAAMRKAGRAGSYAAYQAERKEFGSSPAFYLDNADMLFQQQQPELAVRVLTNIAELDLESPPLLRIIAHRLEQIGETDLAIKLFENILRMRPEEPQSYRDLALALESRGDSRHAQGGPSRLLTALADYQRAMALLNEVVVRQWDDRFPEVEVIALEEWNHLANKVRTLSPAHEAALPPQDRRLMKLLDVDVRIALTWDTDLTDMDLWVTEPSGEKCFYAHNRTTIGGAISRDFTQGYGPEVYMVRHAMPGPYKIQANFFGSRQQILSGPTTLQATVITHYGRPNEQRRSLTLRLTTTKEVVDIGSITVGE